MEQPSPQDELEAWWEKERPRYLSRGRFQQYVPTYRGAGCMFALGSFFLLCAMFVVLPVVGLGKAAAYFYSACGLVATGLAFWTAREEARATRRYREALAAFEAEMLRLRRHPKSAAQLPPPGMPD